MFLRSGDNYDVDEASYVSGLECPESDGRTQQQFAEEVDINTIVTRFGLTGQLPEEVKVPQSGDFTGVTDFQSAMESVRKAEADFMELPADLRYRFENNPQRLMDFMENPANRDEAIKLGLVNKPPEKTRDVVQAVDELAAKWNVVQPK